MEPANMDFDDDGLDFAQYLKRQQKKQEDKRSHNDSAYRDCIHAIKGTAAGCERVWSMAEAVFTKRRSRMSPLLLECILYLKYNRDLWGLEDVVEANHRRKNESKAKAANDPKLKAKYTKMRNAIEAWNGVIPNDDYAPGED